MRNKTVSAIGVVAVTAGLMLAGCSAAEQQQTEAPAVKAPAQVEAKAKAKAEVYPIDFCVVSGEKLGSMGDPVDFTYNGRTIKLCCSGCIKTIEANPAMYIAKLDSAAATMMEATGHEGHNH